MPKGKYATRAANKREAAEVEASEAAYRRQIVRLTEERNQARAERDKALADWNKEVRILRAQLAEGTSPRVEALTRELNRVREERDRIKTTYRDSRAKWHGASDRLVAHMVKEHGMLTSDALDAVMTLITGVSKVVPTGTDERVLEAFGADVLKALRKARGL